MKEKENERRQIEREDSEVLQLIALKGEMEPKFVRNGKKQGNFFSQIVKFKIKIGSRIGAN